MTRLKEFYQHGHDPDSDDHNGNQTDRELPGKFVECMGQIGFRFLDGEGQSGFWFLDVAGQPGFQFVQIVLRGESVINQLSLGIRQHFGLRYRHARLGQALHKRMGIKTDRAHRLRGSLQLGGTLDWCINLAEKIDLVQRIVPLDVEWPKRTRRG